jgi:hypothetical protein
MYGEDDLYYADDADVFVDTVIGYKFWYLRDDSPELDYDKSLQVIDLEDATFLYSTMTTHSSPMCTNFRRIAVEPSIKETWNNRFEFNLYARDREMKISHFNLDAKLCKYNDLIIVCDTEGQYHRNLDKMRSYRIHVYDLHLACQNSFSIDRSQFANATKQSCVGGIQICDNITYIFDKTNDTVYMYSFGYWELLGYWKVATRSRVDGMHDLFRHDYAYRFHPVNGMTLYDEQLYFASNEGIYIYSLDGRMINELDTPSMSICVDEDYIYSSTGNEVFVLEHNGRVVNCIDLHEWLNSSYPLNDSIADAAGRNKSIHGRYGNLLIGNVGVNNGNVFFVANGVLFIFKPVVGNEKERIVRYPSYRDRAKENKSRFDSIINEQMQKASDTNQSLISHIEKDRIEQNMALRRKKGKCKFCGKPLSVLELLVDHHYSCSQYID